jgi:hypothetical protein
MLKLIPIAASVLALAACGSGMSPQMEDQKDPDCSLVYGYIDMTNGPCWLQWFYLHQVLPKTEKPFFNFRVDEGAFYAEFVVSGSYQLHELGGWGSWPNGNTSYNFLFPKQAEGLRIEKPGLYYIGSYKMKDLGNFFKSKYDIELAETPSEREVLSKVLPHAKGTIWEERIRQRLETLK